MLEIPHVAVGLAIAYKTGNPALALPLSITSHFLLDMVPHWNPHLNSDLKKYGRVSYKNVAIIVADSLVAGLMIASFAFKYFPDNYMVLTFLLGGLGGMLPDLVEAPHFFLKFRHPLMDKYIKWQKSIQNDTSILPGVFTQIATFLIAMWVLGR